MNLQSTIELFAGGPGSGCKGPNCGRPSTGGSLISRSGLGKTELDIHPRTVTQVNKILSRIGVEERLAYTAKDAEVYWQGGRADMFHNAGVGVARPSHLTIGKYLEDLQYKLEYDRNVGTKVMQTLRDRYKL